MTSLYYLCDFRAVFKRAAKGCQLNWVQCQLVHARSTPFMGNYWQMTQDKLRYNNHVLSVVPDAIWATREGNGIELHLSSKFCLQISIESLFLRFFGRGNSALTTTLWRMQNFVVFLCLQLCGVVIYQPQSIFKKLKSLAPPALWRDLNPLVKVITVSKVITVITKWLQWLQFWKWLQRLSPQFWVTQLTRNPCFPPYIFSKKNKRRCDA